MPLKILNILFLFITFSGLKIYAQVDTTKDTVPVEQLNYELLVFAERGEANSILLWLGRGADVNAMSAEGISALMYASQNGHLQAVKVLVANGADIDYHPGNEFPPLSAAVINNRIEVVDYLLYKNADVNIRNYNGITPLMLAAAYGYYPVVALILKYKPQLSLKDDWGNDALMMSVVYEHSDITQLLLDNKANVNTADFRGFTPLHVASQKGLESYIQLLSGYGADFQYKNANGVNVLGTAIINSRTEILPTLLKYDSTSITTDRKTISLAYLSHNRGIIKILKKSGSPRIYLPVIENFFAGTGFDANFQDLLFGFKAGIKDCRYNLRFTFSFFSRYWYKRTVTDYGNNIYFQFWEKRAIISGGINRYFILSRNGNNFKGIEAGFVAYNTYGKYRGSVIKPAALKNITPVLAFFTEGRTGGLSLTLNYIDYEVENIFPLRLNISAYFNISKVKQSSLKKAMEW